MERPATFEFPYRQHRAATFRTLHKIHLAAVRDYLLAAGTMDPLVLAFVFLAFLTEYLLEAGLLDSAGQYPVIAYPREFPGLYMLREAPQEFGGRQGHRVPVPALAVLVGTIAVHHLSFRYRCDTGMVYGGLVHVVRKISDKPAWILAARGLRVHVPSTIIVAVDEHVPDSRIIERGKVAVEFQNPAPVETADARAEFLAEHLRQRFRREHVVAHVVPFPV